jgi:hypothetical protein
VLFGPQLDQRLGYPDPQGAQAVEAGMAGGADGDEQFAPVDARAAVVDVEPVAGPAAPTGPAITLQNLVAQAAEAVAGVGGGAIAGTTQAGEEGQIAAAGAEEGALGGGCQRAL